MASVTGHGDRLGQKAARRKRLTKIAKWTGGAIAVPVLVGVSVWGITQILAPHHSAPSRTSIKFMRPLTNRSDQRDGTFIVEGHFDGFCSRGSETDQSPDALRCYTSSHGPIDPCFQTVTAQQAVCISDPWSESVVLVSTHGLPITPSLQREKALKERRPWALELANGKRCAAVDGATGTIAGLRIDYFCGDSEDGIVGSPDSSGEPWTVSYVLGDLQETSEVDVLTAWY
jgi:hypothetical protein